MPSHSMNYQRPIFSLMWETNVRHVQCPEQGPDGTEPILAVSESERLHTGRHNRNPLSEGQRGMTGVAK